MNARECHVHIDRLRYPRDGVSIDYASNDYLDQYGDLKLFFKEYVGEELLKPFISYTNMKTKYPLQKFHLRFQVDHINPNKFQLFGEYKGATANARLFMILVRHRENKMISHGKKITDVKII